MTDSEQFGAPCNYDGWRARRGEAERRTQGHWLDLAGGSLVLRNEQAALL